MLDKTALWNNLYQSTNYVATVVPRANEIVDDFEIKTTQEWDCLSWSAALAPRTYPPNTMVFGYDNPELSFAALKNLELLGYMIAIDDKNYQATGKAKLLVKRIREAQFQVLSEHKPLPDSDINRLISLLDRIIDSAINLETHAPRMEVRLGLHDPLEPPVLWKFISRVMSLEHFRQDAHCTSWQVHDINAHVWEITTLFWLDQSDNLEDLASKIEYRGFSLDQTKAAFQDLINLGWIEPAETGEKYHISEKGKAIRQQAEVQTDRHFFAAWDDLSENELQDIHEMITTIQDYFVKQG
jgi:hypothetical protein